ncbi:unnamed protein product [Camellia sinensis]
MGYSVPRDEQDGYVYVICVEKLPRAAKARLPAGCPPERKEYRPKSYGSDTMINKD